MPGRGAGGGKFGCGFEDPADKQRQDEITAAIAVRTEDPVKADPAGGAESGGDVTVRQAALNSEGFALGGDDGAASEHAAQPFDVGGRPVREVAEGALTDLATLAIAPRAEEWHGASSGSGRLRYTWRMMSTPPACVQVPNSGLHGYVLDQFLSLCESDQWLNSGWKREARAKTLQAYRHAMRKDRRKLCRLCQLRMRSDLG